MKPMTRGLAIHNRRPLVSLKCLESMLAHPVDGEQAKLDRVMLIEELFRHKGRMADLKSEVVLARRDGKMRTESIV